jgi:type VI secretion system secreted protein VgrG
VSASFELHTDVAPASELVVVDWKCDETICGTYRIDAILKVAASAADDLAAKLLGQRALFSAHHPKAPSLVRRGVVASVEASGSHERDTARLHVSVVPRLELMRLHTTSRIFENVTTAELIEALAKEWHFEADVRLTGSYNPRTYITQYRESDYAFLQRIASRDGMGFFIEHRELGDEEPGQIGTERVVFYDNTEAYPDIPAADAARGARLVHDPLKSSPHEHYVEAFRLARRVSPESVALSDFDFRKPRLPLRAGAKVDSKVRSPIGTSLGAEQLALTTHADRAELDPTAKANVEVSEPVAGVRLEQARRDASVGKGKSRCGRLAPGYTFLLEEHPDLASLNRELVVTRVRHVGSIPEKSDSGIDLLYTNEFECVPADVVYRTDVPNLDARQASETATVVGPKGSDIHCDEHGRIKVQFHWDYSGASGEMRAIWLRVVQSWGGANWGTQFIPRVGMEVLVGFLGGDVDRPIVVGSVYNGTHPLPFPMPEGARKSGFRTQSTPGGDGGSELSFDDTKGEEKIFIHAEKDLTQHVDNDYALVVKGGQHVNVTGPSTHTIGGGSTFDILGDATQKIAKNFESTIAGSQTVTVTGASDLRVAGARTTRVEGNEKLELFGSSESVFHEDTVQRALGHHITVVGQNGARRSATLHVEGSAYQYTTGTSEIVADKVIVLRCGESSIRMTPDGIDLVAKTIRLQAEKVETNATEEVITFAKKQVAFVAEKIDLVAEKKIVAKAEEGVLALDKNARLDGAMVKLNCDPEKPDEREAPEYEPPKPTKIELVDENGKPLGHRRYVVVESDGSERSGMLNEEGKAELFLEESAEVFFPDVDDARPE